MRPAVDVHKLGYRYGRSAILEDLSFSITAGVFFIVIGPNGSGKTTLMKIMAGHLRPRRGKISILGKSLRSYSRRQLACRMAYLPQLTRLDFPMSVKDLVLMGRSPHLGMLGLESDQDHRLAENAMRYTHVLHLSGRRMDQLSGGEQQRVLIARAICQQPEIILLDEPTAALDLAHQVAVMDLMERLKLEKNITVVMISHDVSGRHVRGSPAAAQRRRHPGPGSADRGAAPRTPGSGLRVPGAGDREPPGGLPSHHPGAPCLCAQACVTSQKVRLTPNQWSARSVSVGRIVHPGEKPCV